ncbi:MAG: hypothetical protein ACPG4X_21250, partial [Pikeienuella sp.]
ATPMADLSTLTKPELQRMIRNRFTKLQNAMAEAKRRTADAAPSGDMESVESDELLAQAQNSIENARDATILAGWFPFDPSGAN